VTHIYGNNRIVEWLRENEYHPRSPKHGSASCMFLIDDLLYESDLFFEAAQNNEIVYKEDHTVGEGQLRWNIDLVVGPPANEVQVPLGDERPIAEGNPAEIWLAVDAKSVMTEHGKARRNRQRDINSFADIMYHHYPGAVTGGVLLINMAERFRSPLRDEGDITTHDNIERLVEETIEIFENIDRSDGEINPNVDAVGCVVVEHTNLDDAHQTRLVDEAPGPQLDDTVHYQNFLKEIIDTFESRFLTSDPLDMDELREADVLRNELNDMIIELAHIAHVVGRAIEMGDVTNENVNELREAVATVEDLVDEIEHEHVEE
jgi:hypothetical protein